MGCIGSLAKVQVQLKWVDLCATLKPKDAKDVWRYAGNGAPNDLVDMPLHLFLKSVKRLTDRCEENQDG